MVRDDVYSGMERMNQNNLKVRLGILILAKMHRVK